MGREAERDKAQRSGPATRSLGRLVAIELNLGLQLGEEIPDRSYQKLFKIQSINGKGIPIE
jgi:hypothetical protein